MIGLEGTTESKSDAENVACTWPVGNMADCPWKRRPATVDFSGFTGVRRQERWSTSCTLNNNRRGFRKFADSRRGIFPLQQQRLALVKHDVDILFRRCPQLRQQQDHVMTNLHKRLLNISSGFCSPRQVAHILNLCCSAFREKEKNC